jgi:hypothetical protein
MARLDGKVTLITGAGAGIGIFRVSRSAGNLLMRELYCQQASITGDPPG